MQPHEQHTRLLSPSLSPGILSNLCPLNWWCYLTISFSAALFSSCTQSFPVSGSFLMSQLFASGGQSIEASASASVFPTAVHGWFPLGLTGLNQFLGVQETLKSLLQHNLKASVLWCSTFFMAQLSHLYMTAGKIIYSDNTDLSAKWCLCVGICCLGL